MKQRPQKSGGAGSIFFNCCFRSNVFPLFLALIITISLGITQEPAKHCWQESLGIFIFLLIICCLSFGTAISEAQAQKLSEPFQSMMPCSVIRGGRLTHVNSANLVIGDVLEIQCGTLIPADCIVISAVDHFGIDES